MAPLNGLFALVSKHAPLSPASIIQTSANLPPPPPLPLHVTQELFQPQFNPAYSIRVLSLHFPFDFGRPQPKIVHAALTKN